MLRKTLTEIVEVVRLEARLSTNTSRGIDHGDHIRQLIRTAHEALAEEFDWPHLRLRRGDSFKTLAAGQRYYDFPTNLNVQKIEAAWVQWGAQWSPLHYGITPQHYSALDSDSDARSDPVQVWEWYSADALDQFEVWPLPGTDGGLIAFEGQRRVSALVEEADRCEIDHLCIALTVAAEILAENGKSDAAKLKLAKANGRINQVRSNTTGASGQGFVIGGVDPNMRQRGHGRDIRYVRGGG